MLCGYGGLDIAKVKKYAISDNDTLRWIYLDATAKKERDAKFARL